MESREADSGDDDAVQEAPWREGVVEGKDADLPADRGPLTGLAASQAATLAELTVDYSFFTPALLYSAFDLQERDPIADFIRETQESSTMYHLRLPQPAFGGLEHWDPAWNFLLFVLEKPAAARFYRWIGQLTLVDRFQRRVARIRYRDVAIVDILAANRRIALPDDGLLPRVSVTALCLDTNSGCYYFADGQGNAPPQAAFTPQVFPDTQAIADALFATTPDTLSDSDASVILGQPADPRFKEARNGTMRR